MFDPEFFPTPKSVVRQMLEPFINGNEITGDLKPHRKSLVRAKVNEMMILDPSAGSGSMLKALREIVDDRPSHISPFGNNIHAIERNPDLQAVLKEHGWQVVHDDFLTFSTNLRYDLILMNPPFSNGDEHLLHAWDILQEGDIVCLLNANTIKLAHTERRKRLAALIEQHGSVEFLGPVFGRAERKTNVDVALVRLRKEDESGTFDFLKDDEFTKHADKESFAFDEENMGTPAVNNIVKLYVDQFHLAQDAFVDYMKAKHKMERRAELFITNTYSKLNDLLAEVTKNGTGPSQFNAFTRKMQGLAWDLIFQNTKLHDLMTRTVRTNFSKMQQEHGMVSFNEANIHALFEMLFLNRHEILRQGIVDAFDMMTKYHKDNRIEEGWATNDAFKVNKKVIMPYAVTANYSGGLRIKHEYEQTINDVDRALAMLDGKKLRQVYSAAEALEEHFKSYRTNSGALENNVVTSEHFKLRFFKKGTVHLFFLDEKLWQRFNIAAAQGKNWLPMDYGRKPEANAQQDEQQHAHRAQQLLLN